MCTFILIDYVTIMRMFSMGQGVTHASNLMVTCMPPILHNVASLDPPPYHRNALVYLRTVDIESETPPEEGNLKPFSQGLKAPQQ